MAKKKDKEKEAEDSSENKESNTLVDKIFKEFKIDRQAYLNDIVLNEDYAIFSVSPRIDMTCGGGVQEGGSIVISGPEKLGKTTLALAIAASAQQHEQIDGIRRKVFYFDIENRIQKRYLKNQGLNIDPDYFELIGSTGGVLLSAEKNFQLMEKLISSLKNSVVIIDSLSMLCSESELEYDYSDTYRSNAPRLTSIFFRKISGMIRHSRNTVIGIIHSYANQNSKGPFSPSRVESGGTKAQYASNYKFVLTHKEAIKESDVVVGDRVHFKCAWHPLDKQTNPVSNFIHTYGLGLDKVREIAEMAKETGLVKSKGPYIYFGDLMWQGIAAFADSVRNDPELYKALVAAIYEIID